MTKHITIIQGHPDSTKVHFGHALTDVYIKGAEAAGHKVRRISVAELDLPLLHSKEEWETATSSHAILQAQESISWAQHIVITYPLWLGTMPAILKAFFEQVFRPGFAVNNQESDKMWRKLLPGKSARIIITMGIPALFYRCYFRAHSLKSLERNILAFTGIGPIKSSLIGLVETMEDNKRKKWIDKMYKLGKRAV